MSFLNDVLSNVLHKRNEPCCLCFKTKENDHFFNFEDLVTLSLGDSIKISEMLTYIFHNEAKIITSAFTKLCIECFDSTKQSYEFIKTTLEKSQQLYNALEGLSSALVYSNTDFVDCNTLFVSLNMGDYTSQQYRDNTQSTSRAAAFQRFNTIIGVQNSKPNIEIDLHVFPLEQLEEIKKPPRKHKQRNILKSSDMFTRQEDSTLKCKKCHKIFGNIFNLRNHFIRVHAPKDFKCDICNRRYGSIGFLERHKLESHCSVVCSECGKTFQNRHTLRMHEIGHHLKIVCTDCGRTYKNQSNYQIHIKKNICGQESRATPSNAKYECDYCGKKYTHKESLRVHIQFEHGNFKKLKCQFCSKTFCAQSRLQAHIVTHTKEKKFPCEICGGKFVSKMSLIYHTRLHTGEKPYACKFCTQRFITNSRRTVHEKQFHLNAIVCERCHVKFKCKKHLENHRQMCRAQIISMTDNQDLGFVESISTSFNQ